MAENAVDGEGLVCAVGADVRYLNCAAREVAGHERETAVKGGRELDAAAGNRCCWSAGEAERRVLDVRVPVAG